MNKIGPEQIIKNSILEWFRFQKDCFVIPIDSVGIFDPVKKIYRRKNSKFHIKGVSDILGIWKGRPLAIEVKSPIGRVTAEQNLFLNNYRRCGGIAIVARSVEAVIETLNAADIIR